MQFLLDTCVVVWFFEGSHRIPADLCDTLRDPGNDILFSDVSILEIAIKYELGKLPMSQPPSRILLPLAQKHFMSILALATDDILGLEGLPKLHRDPFDRLLIAQSHRRRIPLVTPDALIRQYPIHTVWD